MKYLLISLFLFAGCDTSDDSQFYDLLKLAQENERVCFNINQFQIPSPYHGFYCLEHIEKDNNK